MQMQALVIGADVNRKYYGYVEFNVADMSVSQGRQRKSYTCRIYDGVPGITELRELAGQGQLSDPNHVAALSQAADSIAAGLPQTGQMVTLEIYDMGGNGKYAYLVAQLH